MRLSHHLTLFTLSRALGLEIPQHYLVFFHFRTLAVVILSKYKSRLQTVSAVQPGKSIRELKEEPCEWLKDANHPVVSCCRFATFAPINASASNSLIGRNLTLNHWSTVIQPVALLSNTFWPPAVGRSLQSAVTNCCSWTADIHMLSNCSAICQRNVAVNILLFFYFIYLYLLFGVSIHFRV